MWDTALNQWADTVEWTLKRASAQAIKTQTARQLKTFQIELQEDAEYDGYLAFKRIGRLSLTLVGYGAEVTVDAGQLGQFSLLQWPLTGSYLLKVGMRELHVNRQVAHLIPARVPLRLEISRDCLMLIVRMSAQGARELGLEGGPTNAPAQELSEALGFPIDLSSKSGASLKHVLSYLLEEGFTADMLANDRALGRFAESLYLGALKGALNDVTGLNPSKKAAPYLPKPPSYLARAEAYLLDHMVDPVSITDTARAAGVSTSALKLAFGKYHGMPPLAWLKTKRLDRAFEDLSKPQTISESVTEVGLKWGFFHLGRFSKDYAARFGESPRHTKQRARAAT